MRLAKGASKTMNAKIPTSSACPTSTSSSANRSGSSTSAVRPLFRSALRNYGTKEATNVLVTANLSPNLKFEKYGGGLDNREALYSKTDHLLKFPTIEKIGPNKQIVLQVLVSVTDPEPKQAICRVSVVHDDLAGGDKFEDMAYVKVTKPGRGALTESAAP